MLAQIEQVLRCGGTNEPPAYTIILGAGASSGVVPTAREMLGLPGKAGAIHDDCIPFWIDRRLSHSRRNPISSSPDEQRTLVRRFWEHFFELNPDLKPSESYTNNVSVIDLFDGVTGSTSIVADAYKALFNQKRTGGLTTPQLARSPRKSAFSSPPAAESSGFLSIRHGQAPRESLMCRRVCRWRSAGLLISSAPARRPHRLTCTEPAQALARFCKAAYTLVRAPRTTAAPAKPISRLISMR
jgi:hypothetical protein